jgi:hypothetical protein
MAERGEPPSINDSMAKTFQNQLPSSLNFSTASSLAPGAMIDNPQRPDWADPKHWAPFVVVGEPAKPVN